MRNTAKLKEARRWIDFIIWCIENNKQMNREDERAYIDEAIKELKEFKEVK